MASIKKIEGKKGVSYKITVTCGLDLQGKKIRHFKTWTPPAGMGARKAEKEVKKVAYDFERELELGFQADCRQTFEKYAWYVIGLKESQGARISTVANWKRLMVRITKAIGHMRLQDIKVQHLNAFYRELEKTKVSRFSGRAEPKVDFKALIKDRGITQREFGEMSGVSHTTAEKVCGGLTISLESAELIAKALGQKVDDLFTVTQPTKTLSTSTIRAYHSLISVIFEQAEREMLIIFNPASRATKPKQQKYIPDYLQPDELARFLECLEDEPIKWRTITHLLAVTGCRRGEILGLKWSKVDFENRQLKIDVSIHYVEKVGVYEGPTKTGNVRYVTIPAETVKLLRQYKAWQAEQRLGMGDAWQGTEDYVFTANSGKPMIPENYLCWLNKFTKRHGLPHVHPHTLRHTFASILISEGVDITTVAGALGHANTSMTLDVYSHVIEESKRKATECIADVMLRKKKA